MRDFALTMNKNKSVQKKGVRSQIYQKTTHKEHQKLREKFKTGKNHGVARKFTIIERLQGEKEKDITAALYNSSRFSTTTLVTAHLLL